MKRYAKGYTQGVFDMFHVGHLNLINNAKERCEALHVGVNSDRLVRQYKHRSPVIPENERCQIVKNISAVDAVLIADTLDKLEMHRLVGFDVVFVGSDWEGSPRWRETEAALRAVGVDVVYLPYTRGICGIEDHAVHIGVVPPLHARHLQHGSPGRDGPANRGIGEPYSASARNTSLFPIPSN